jgi:c-di-GMP-binding flagellar brake protein YcgR
MSANRRRFFRVKASLRFTFAWEGGFELFRTVDLSAAGAMVVRTEGVLPAVGTVGECAFNLASMEIRTGAKVMRVEGDRFAVEFTGLSRAHEDQICAWVFRQETRKD